MNVHIPQDQLDFVEGLVSSGRFTSMEEAVAEGIRLLASSERLREQIQTGTEQADRGELVSHDTVFAQLRSMAITQANNPT